MSHSFLSSPLLSYQFHTMSTFSLYSFLYLFLFSRNFFFYFLDGLNYIQKLNWVKDWKVFLMKDLCGLWKWFDLELSQVWYSLLFFFYLIISIFILSNIFLFDTIEFKILMFDKTLILLIFLCFSFSFPFSFPSFLFLSFFFFLFVALSLLIFCNQVSVEAQNLIINCYSQQGLPQLLY